MGVPPPPKQKKKKLKVNFFVIFIAKSPEN
jgi:hypothetical protein